ncbi:MAG: transporter [Azospirillaceae bacterium]|nr:transporter [Azospirillaceae bacterium]
MALACAAAATHAPRARAEELWDPYLRGMNEGSVAGALPPPGLYAVLDNYAGIYTWRGAGGHATDPQLYVQVEVPIVLWSTGWKVLGADYAAALSQPFIYTGLRSGGGATKGHWGTFNTIAVPAILSWDLGQDVHLKTSLGIYVPDASSDPAHAPANGGAASGNGYWTVEPGIGLSWLSHGWNLSLDLHYDHNFRDTTTGYRSGDEIAVDYTAMRDLGSWAGGRWSAGLGAHQETQVEDDSGPGSASCAAKAGCRVGTYGLGPLLGYKVGGIGLTLEYNHNLYTQNDFAGEIVNLRLETSF